MKKAKIYADGIYAGDLIELEKGAKYRFEYAEGYKGPSISLTLPMGRKIYEFDKFPPFFEGLLPEGMMLEGLLKRAKIDENDLFEQLVRVGGDLIGNITVERKE